MADIELIVKIPKEMYEQIRDSDTIFRDDERTCYEAVKNGTPLPKGHGRIGDLDKIQSMAREKAENCFPEGRYDYGYRKALFDFAKDIDNATPVIEADKAESEEVKE